MKQNAPLFILITLIVIQLSCKSGKQSPGLEQINIQSIANEAIGFKTRCLENSEKSYTLCYMKSKELGPRKVTFMVIDTNTGNTVVDVTKLNGEVTWYNDTLLTIEEDVRIIENKSGAIKNNTYYFDILKKKRIAAIM